MAPLRSFLICDSAILSDAFLTPTTIKVHVVVHSGKSSGPNYLHLAGRVGPGNFTPSPSQNRA